MADVCRRCNSSSIIDDNHGGQSHRVCTDCGEVIDSATSFEQERDYWSGVTCCNVSGAQGGSNLGKYRNIRQGDPNAPKRHLRPWMNYVREVCSMMKVTAEMENGVMDVFTRAFKGSIKCKQSEKKQALCGAVLYTICRQHDWPVVLSDISMVVESSINDLFAMKQLLARELNIHTPAADIEDIVKTVLKKYGLEDQTFVEKTIKVVSLAKDAWITCGRSHDPAICAAAFLVWKSSSEGRGKVNKFPAFCRQLLDKPPYKTAQRIREIRSILMQLVEKLPWLKSKNVTQEMATLHLDDILRNKKYLISRVELPKETDYCEDDSDAEATREMEHRSNEDDTSNGLSSKAMLPPSWTRIRKRKLRSYDDDGGNENPCKKQTTALSVENSWDEDAISLSEELTDNDIPESEMHLYVRSDSEVADLERLQQTVHMMTQEKTSRD